MCPSLAESGCSPEVLSALGPEVTGAECKGGDDCADSLEGGITVPDVSDLVGEGMPGSIGDSDLQSLFRNDVTAHFGGALN